MVVRLTTPKLALVYPSHPQTAATRPTMAPETAPTAVHLDQTMQNAIGQTAEPMITPINRYTYLHTTDMARFASPMNFNKWLAERMVLEQNKVWPASQQSCV